MKKVLILGATSGIARAFANDLAAKQYNLILAGRHTEELNLLANDMKIRYETEVNVQYFDALEFETHDKFFTNLLSRFGEIDGVFLAYGFMGEQKEAEKNFALAKKMIDTNYTSVVSIINIVANYFEEKKKGFVCVVSSVAGDRGRQSNYIYGSSKGALSVYLQGLRNRLSKSNVSVITVKPGFVDTKMTYGLLKDGSPLVAQPETVARSIYKAIEKKKDTVYVPFFWLFIMLIVKWIPERIFKRLRV